MQKNTIKVKKSFVCDKIKKGQDYKDEDGCFVHNITTYFEDSDNKVKSMLLCLRGNIVDKVEIDFSEKKASFEIEEEYMIKKLGLIRRGYYL